MTGNRAQTAALLTAAAAAQKEGRSADVVRHLRAVLALDTAQPQALNTLGMMELGSGNFASAADLFSRAVRADPGEPSLWMNLAKAQRELGDDAGERASLEGALGVDRRHFMALVRKAELHERLGEPAQAVSAWQGVLALAPGVAPSSALEALVAHARAFVSARARLFADAIEQQLEMARSGLASADTRRFDACVDHVLGRRAIYVNECAGLHFPFLPAEEYFERGRFDWVAMLEAGTSAVRGELEALLADARSGFTPYVDMDSGIPESKWTALDRSEDWSALHLWRQGVRDAEACRRCPATSALVESLPLACIPGRAPTVFFSLLRPRTRIPAHTGVTNTRAILHLPLIVPDRCGFRVGGETRSWREGEVLAFDDTIEHEAWNDSDDLRAVLILDVWNPNLTAIEQELIRAYFAAADASGHDPSA